MNDLPPFFTVPNGQHILRKNLVARFTLYPVDTDFFNLMKQFIAQYFIMQSVVCCFVHLDI